jgi:hypothetical protein
MKVGWLILAAAFAALLPTGAFADDPRDPAMRSAEARARDRETIRQLNLQEAARVRERDERYAAGWQAYRNSQAATYPRSTDYEQARANYDRDRSRYERGLAAWRRAVSACRAGNYSACDS